MPGRGHAPTGVHVLREHLHRPAAVRTTTWVATPMYAVSATVPGSSFAPPPAPIVIFSGRTPAATFPERPSTSARTTVPSSSRIVPAPSIVPGQQVRDAEEPGDERGRGPLVELRRRPELLDPAAVHHGDRVGHRHRLLLVVRDVDERDPDLVLDALQLELHLLAELQVERAERLVEQEDARVVHERARERDALLLTARELPRLALREAGEPHELEDLGDAALQLALGDALPLEPEGDVVLDRHVREERVALEHRVDVALVRRQPDDVLVAQVDVALGRLLEAADHAQRRRLAAARRAEQREERAARDLDRDSVDGNRVVEPLDDAIEADVRGRRFRGCHRASVSRW